MMQVRIVDKNKIIILLFLLIKICLQHLLYDYNLFFDFLGRLILINLFLHFSHFCLIEKFVDGTFFVCPVTDDQAELVHDLVLLCYNLVTQLHNHFVGLDVVEEGERNRFLARLLICLLFKDLGEAIPPSAKLFSRIENISIELLKLGLKFVLGWMEQYLGEIVCAGHPNEIRFLVPVV
jgi:hypothetical protein